MNHRLKAMTRSALAAMLVIGSTASAQVPQVPSDAALDQVSKQQNSKSAEAIARAQHQADRLHQPVPDVTPAVLAPLPVPDPAAIAQRHITAARSEGSIYILISLSMPLPTIGKLAEQARKAGAPLVLRGVAEESLQRTLERTADIVRQHPGAEIQIDPTLFRRFKVTEVPAFILSVKTFDTGACTTHCDLEDSYSLVTGDVSVEYALEHLSRHSPPPLAAVAKGSLQRYQETP